MTEDVSKAPDDAELPPLDNRLVASAAATLDAVKIPHVLWGHYLLTVFGIPTIVEVRTLIESELSNGNPCPRASTSLLKTIS